MSNPLIASASSVDRLEFATKHKDEEPEEIKRRWLAQVPKPKRAMQDRTITKAKTGKSVPRASSSSKPSNPWKALESAISNLEGLLASAKANSGIESMSAAQLLVAYSAKVKAEALAEASQTVEPGPEV
tara:strand:+ start:58 stop:444 length:387 start_codon:yes stop_codon:yes gene_type:complete